MYQQITNYQPYNEQEAKDKELLLKVLKQKDVLTRENEVGHFTVSCWVLNQNHNKVLMCYHKVYNSWSWLGGHVDGEKNFKKVALKEVQEESGLENVSFMSDDLKIDQVPCYLARTNLDTHKVIMDNINRSAMYQVIFIIM